MDGVAVAATYDATTGTLTPDAPLGEGAHTLTYTLIDSGNNESTPSNSFTYNYNNPPVAVADHAVITVPTNATFYYTTSGGEIVTFNPTTGAMTVIGNPSNAGAFYDIATTPNGNLYGILPGGGLYSINTATAAATLIGNANIACEIFRG